MKNIKPIMNLLNSDIDILSPIERYGKYHVITHISHDVMEEYCKNNNKNITNKYEYLSNDELNMLYEKSKERELEFMDNQNKNKFKDNIFCQNVLQKAPSKENLKKYLEPINIEDYKKKI